MNLNKFSWFLKKTLKYYTIFKPKNKNELQEAVNHYCENDDNKLNLCLYSQVRRLKNYRFACINTWDVSNVTDMSDMFKNAINFNQPLNNWDVSNVAAMSSMFFGARNFNQPLNNWDVSNVTNTSEAGTL